MDLSLKAGEVPIDLKRPAFMEDGIWKWDDGEVVYTASGYPTVRDLAEVESVISRLDFLIPTLRFVLEPTPDDIADVSLVVGFAGQGDDVVEGLELSNWDQLYRTSCIK